VTTNAEIVRFANAIVSAQLTGDPVVGEPAFARAYAELGHDLDPVALMAVHYMAGCVSGVLCVVNGDDRQSAQLMWLGMSTDMPPPPEFTP
jgi:hypothetical protein